jgi:nucleotide-binding universal stress UspA family protein
MYKTILIPVDLNVESSWHKALPTALTMCRAFGAELHVMTVVPEYGSPMVAQYFPVEYEKKALEHSDEKLKELIDEADTDGITVHHSVSSGTIYEEIINAANDAKADLIVMASHRPQLSDYLLGPNAARVVRHAGQSVLVVRD